MYLFQVAPENGARDVPEFNMLYSTVDTNSKTNIFKCVFRSCGFNLTPIIQTFISQ